MALHNIISAPQTYWEVDPENTSVEFVIGWSPLHRVHGRFHGVHGSVFTTGDTAADAMIQIDIDAASIDTGLPIRDRHLQYDLFLAPERFPTISFVSTDVVDEGNGRLRVSGELTLRGLTREVVLDATVEQRDADRARIKAHTVLDRRDFKMGPPTMGLMAGNKTDVRIELALRAR
jgi:polyisoprenoid-binding protein YceI